MKQTTLLIFALMAMVFSGCEEEGPRGPMGPSGPAGQNAEVYYSEWFSPEEWLGGSGDWYFEATAPDLTEDIVEGGVILAYASLADDIYELGVRPLPAYAVGANWDFVIPEYGLIVFNCDMVDEPLTSGNLFRFIAIPGTIPALKSTSTKGKSIEELKKMSYQEVCRLYNIPEK